jgi:cytochrome c biogenesis protein CcmG, thiol:disulfide interchange protein DsbE
MNASGAWLRRRREEWTMTKCVMGRGAAAVARIGMVAALSLMAAADDEQFKSLRVGDFTYSNVTVTAVTPTDIYITYAGGMDNLKLKDLEPALQKHFGFNRVKAGEAEQTRREGNAQFTSELSRRKAAAPRPQVSEPEAPPLAAEGEDIVVPKLYARSFRGRPAPRIVVDQWLTPAPELAGKFVLVDFWATWCGPCRRSIPHLNELQAKFPDRLVVIGLSDESPDAIRRMASPQINYAVGTDPQKRTSREVEVSGIPHAMLIDPKGIVRFEGMPGYLTESVLDRLLRKYGG